MNLVRRPFTLIELLTVMAIIVVLAGTVVAVAPVVQRKIKITRCKAQIKALEVALDQYNNDWGYYPQSTPASVISRDFVEGNGTDSGLARPDNAKPYLDLASVGLSFVDDTLRDPWGNPYFYECPGTMNAQKYDLWSMGYTGGHGHYVPTAPGDYGDPSDAQDTAADTSDDLANWRRLN